MNSKENIFKKNNDDIDLNLSICNHKIFHHDSIKKTISINLEDYLTIKDFAILEFSGDNKSKYYEKIFIIIN